MTAEEMVREAIEEELCPDFQYGIDTKLGHLGADSLDTVQLVLWFEDRLHIDVPDEMIDDLKNVGDLIELVRKNGKGYVSDAYEKI